jgi:hypothetical protein
MLFSKDWLSQYVELPADDQELARRLTFAGLAVEYVEAKGDDVVFDIDVTTNRPDCMNHFGVAREISVLLDRPLQSPPQLADAPLPPGEAGGIASVTIEDGLCPRYSAKIIRGVTVGPSPDWLRRRLEAIGSRSINNVVDITNYVLWELGQPLHAFDLAKLAGPAIVVRAARQGEELVTLDGERRTLDPEVLVIADSERAVARQRGDRRHGRRAARECAFRPPCRAARRPPARHAHRRQPPLRARCRPDDLCRGRPPRRAPDRRAGRWNGGRRNPRRAPRRAALLAAGGSAGAGAVAALHGRRHLRRGGRAVDDRPRLRAGGRR